MTGLDELIEHLERRAQLDALRRADLVLFPYSSVKTEQEKQLETKLRELIHCVENGGKL